VPELTYPFCTRLEPTLWASSPPLGKGSHTFQPPRARAPLRRIESATTRSIPARFKSADAVSPAPADIRQQLPEHGRHAGKEIGRRAGTPPGPGHDDTRRTSSSSRPSASIWVSTPCSAPGLRVRPPGACLCLAFPLAGLGTPASPSLPDGREWRSRSPGTADRAARGSLDPPWPATDEASVGECVHRPSLTEHASDRRPRESGGAPPDLGGRVA
jgi:hypothetical protein